MTVLQDQDIAMTVLQEADTVMTVHSEAETLLVTIVSADNPAHSKVNLEVNGEKE